MISRSFRLAAGRALPGSLCAALLAVTGTTAGAEPTGKRLKKDLSVAYHARETVNDRDNDILRLRYGIADPGIAGLSRLAVFGGFRDVGLNLFADSESVSLEHPDIGAEALWMKERPDGRHGLGARVNYAGDHETSIEVAGVYERFDRMFDLRLVGGVQGVTDNVAGREDFGAFGLGEVTWWYREDFLFRGGVQADTDGEIASFGFEVAIGRRPLSFFLDWGHALDDYRDISGYNDLSAGFRYDFGGATLRERVREGHSRSLFRPVEVQ